MHFANFSFTLLPLCLFHSQLTPLENALKTPLLKEMTLFSMCMLTNKDL